MSSMYTKKHHVTKGDIIIKFEGLKSQKMAVLLIILAFSIPSYGIQSVFLWNYR